MNGGCVLFFWSVRRVGHLEMFSCDLVVLATVPRYQMFLMTLHVIFLEELFQGVVLVALSTGFSSVWRPIPRVGSIERLGRPPVRFPVGLARRFVGLLFCPLACSFLVSRLGRPVAASALNIG